MTWLPFNLHPEYPPEGLPRTELIAKYGPGMTERVSGFFAERGLPYNPHPDVIPNSMQALQVSELARDLGRHDAVHDRLMDACWSEAQNIGDANVLRALAAELELPADEVEDVLGGNRYRDRIEDSTRRANLSGANAVPAFVLDRRLLVLGAQPNEVFEQAYRQLDAA